MNILIIGGGGREHALAWKVAQSNRVECVFVAPGNAGTALENKVENVDIDVLDIPALINFVKEKEVRLTIVGPEAPLILGIVDAFKKEGLFCFGPSKAAAQLEGSKRFSKRFMQEHHIPTAHYADFSDIDKAIAYIKKQKLPLVIKANGLAAGKGVVIATTTKKAIAAAENMLVKQAFGEAGKRIIVEEYLEGEEVSFIVMTDGKHILPLATSQDYKARDDDDKGPNTGGMGAYSPAAFVTPELSQRIMHHVIEPTVRGMADAGTPYTGFLYVGLMITKAEDIKVLEFNCRCGDPETQPIVLRLKTDLIALCEAAEEERLHEMEVVWDNRVALGVVMTAGGYPNKYRRGDTIHDLPPREIDALKIFHAGTRQVGGEVVTDGGRVLCVTALGISTIDAQKRAYQWVEKIHWNNNYYRTDIGYREIVREENAEMERD